MPDIIDIHARQILDSRGNPTVEVEVFLLNGGWGRAAVPSGASTGEHEAVELRDKGDAYGGKGVLRAIENIERIIAPEICGLSAINQAAIDELMIQLDGTPNKGNLGANAILAVSMAVSRAAASHLGLPLYRYLGGPNARHLPIPFMNILNGGQHASNPIDLQEFMIVPAGFDSFSRALQAGTEIFHALRSRASSMGLSTSVGDEGGLAPDLPSNKAALELIVESIKDAGYAAGHDVFIALDPAASEFYRNGLYFMHGCDPEGLTSVKMVDYWSELIEDFPIVSIEDGLAENDWEGWVRMNRLLGDRILIIGDDLLVTSEERLSRAIESAAANSILIKLNQIGTVTETMNTVNLAHKNGWKAVVSHRSGETEDTYISDFSVAMNTDLLKTGSACRTDRVAKYNQLLRIEEELGAQGIFRGPQFFDNISGD
ncbi:MAG: phosphopyruvate hydratase [Candidatus Aegiribacteria sp.]|nr:phosphopyruvate hydratase [Candidatus Aegiribacteria sp.]